MPTRARANANANKKRPAARPRSNATNQGTRNQRAHKQAFGVTMSNSFKRNLTNLRKMLAAHARR